MDDIAVVTPYYMAPDAIIPLYNRLENSLHGYRWSLIIVDDRSPDNGWEIIKQLCRSKSNVTGIRLSRNFGQHQAITAGLRHADAQWYAVMDCDLQDRPEDIPVLLEAAKERGAEIAVAERENAALGRRRTLSSVVFNRLFAWLSGLQLSERTGNFRVFSRKAAKAYAQYQEQMRYFPALMANIGFEATSVTLPRDERTIGQSSYSLKKLMSLSVDALISYSEKPLRLMALTGAAVAAASLLVSLYYFVSAIFHQIELPGFASIIIAIFFFGGMTIFLVSFVGLYLGLTLREVRGRPIFIVDEMISGTAKGK